LKIHLARGNLKCSLQGSFQLPQMVANYLVDVVLSILNGRPARCSGFCRNSDVGLRWR